MTREVPMFWEWFSALLKRREMTQEQAARLIGGVTTATVHRWVNGTVSPQYEQLCLVVEAFDESPFDR